MFSFRFDQPTGHKFERVKRQRQNVQSTFDNVSGDKKRTLNSRFKRERDRERALDGGGVPKHSHHLGGWLSLKRKDKNDIDLNKHEI